MRLATWKFVLAIVAFAIPGYLYSQAPNARTNPQTLEEGLGRAVNVAITAPQFASELNGARKQFPLLKTTTQLLIAYAGYLENLVPKRTTLVGPPPVQHPTPEALCRYIPTTCKCWRGDREACITIATDPDSGGPGLKLGDLIVPVITCKNLKQDYTAVLQNILTLLSQSPLTTAQLQDLQDLQANANALYAQLVARGCLS